MENDLSQESMNINSKTFSSMIPGAIAALSMLLITGCGRLPSNESSLDPAGPQSGRINTLTWLFMIVCIVVYALVMLVLLGAILRRRRGGGQGAPEMVIEPEPQHERRIWRVVSGSVAITVVTLFVLLFSDYATGRGIHKLGEKNEKIRIRITGHQWWWEVQYMDWPERFGERVLSNTITTANEIHLPVDKDHPVAVDFELSSADVIHSFWVPNLHGKKDLVPGHPTSVWLRADQVGTYWGECGEFCGYQHAQMRLLVVAEPAEQFKSWLDGQRQPGAEPADDMQKRGQQVFVSASCLMCHAIQGTPAYGRVGPDLTHVGSRRILAAGAIPNMPGHLAGWISDPQRIKPGAKMPQNSLNPKDLRALLEYLEHLK
jgi:cytochrome c oxidase subunit II